MPHPSAGTGLILALTLASQAAFAATTVTPFVGYRFASNIDLRANGAATTDNLRFTDSPSAGIVINTDLDRPSRKFQLYYSHQSTQARADTSTDFGGLTRFDVDIDRLQLGGLYFPSGRDFGGFVDGTLGVTRLDPRSPGLETEYYPSIALGGGTEMPLSSHLRLRLDLRGIYTALNTGASIFCSGGCTARVDSRGFFQVEAAMGLAFRF